MGQAPLTNDTATLTPRTVFDGPSLEFDFPAFRVGVAEYAEGPTGCTVFHFPQGAATALDIAGGSPKTYGNYEFNHAICLAGGSVYGLESATGVAAELFAMAGYSTEPGYIAHVSSAIIFDPPARENAIYPDKALGREALRTARSGFFPLGAHGAGAAATVGKWSRNYERESAGQGAAFRQLGPTKIAVFTVVNAVGALVDRRGQVVCGHLDSATGTRHQLIEDVELRTGLGETQPPPAHNTTLTVLVTNQQLEGPFLYQLARQVHGSMNRAIQPFHTMYDGDVLYAVTTNETDDPTLDDVALGAVASEVAWDAVLSSVQAD
jgi:L-aminopeptidase/D-esterase-like protein